MRRAPGFALLMLAAACDGGASGPQASREAAAGADRSGPDDPAPAPARPVARQTGAASRLTGHSSALSGIVSDFAVERTDFGTRVQIAADTLFAFDKAVLRAAAQANLQRTADLVRQGARGTVTVTGHTDSKGEDAYNLRLSTQRAQAVADWLRAQPGMDGRAFGVQGRGEAEPVAANARADGGDDPQGRARNRRVTVDIPG
jgi:outer membrane protein OmpA-like peptidoglycan-associated protein